MSHITQHNGHKMKNGFPFPFANTFPSAKFTPCVFYPLFLAAILSLLSCQKEAAPTLNTGTTYTVASVDQFTWITGSSNGIQPSKDRLGSSKFVFSDNGTMTYTFDFDPANTYVLTGDYYENSSGGYAFVAAQSTNNGAGSGTQIIVQGTIIPGSSGNFKVTMEYGAGAYYSASVNNQQFFNQASKRFKTVMTVK